MERWPENVYQYIAEHTRFDDPLILEMEQRGRRDGFPIIGPLVGPWLYFFTRLTNAKRVWELGSGFGYSTWYFASAVRDNGGGKVTHTVWDKALSDEARDWLGKANLLEICEFHVSEAVTVFRDTEPGVDIVFMDIDKEGYKAALAVIEQKLRPGGLLLTDNVLWDGRVTDAQNNEPSTESIRAFNDAIYLSPKWQYLVNPLRDGLGVARFGG